MATKTEPFDAAAYLKTDEDIAAYMTEALATRDTAVIGRALGAIARARGMTRISRETGLSRESLYRALSAEGNPEFATVLRIIEALGLRLSAEPARKAA
jgi:probable addiction module antidote protein